ncbi:MAG TPA: ABC transporter ATP-binding protein [Chloroflexota bacterium]|jgi:putative ABC transport system ATP-binding protein
MPALQLPPFLSRFRRGSSGPHTPEPDPLAGARLVRRLGPNPNEVIVACRGVERVYDVSGAEKVYALKGVDLDLRRGDLIGLMGRSGSGKTTLLNLIGGLDRPTAGEVMIDGQDVGKLSDAEATELRRHRIGYIFQSFALMPVLSALENVELPMHIAGMGLTQRRRRAVQLLELVGLGRRMHHRPFELSGGEQQRTAIARALANRPTLILADEPIAELDSVTGLQILKLLMRVRDVENVTVVIATHDATIHEVADRTYHIKDGRIDRIETYEDAAELVG